MSCQVCIEPYTVSSRKKIQCLYCQYESCVQCVKKFILSNRHDPCCMSCKHPWNREFLDANLSRNFRIKEYKKHRENVLFERESSFFPETVQLMEKNQEQKEHCGEKVKDLIKSRKDLQKQLAEINQSILGYRNHMTFLESKSTNTVSDFSTTERKVYIKKCVSQECKGYINHKGTCAICKTVICMQCHELKTEGHTCNKDNVESVNRIKKDSKSCPNCQVSIYKIDGCRQMWCTQCQTAFDWKTGIIIRERIHNPHYYEWEQNNNNASNTTRQCNENELPNLSQVRTLTQQLDLDFLLRRRLFEIHRSIQHLRDYEMVRLQEENRNNELFQRNIEARVLYLKSESDEQLFKNQLVLRENRLERYMNLYLLYEMVCNTCISFFHECLLMNVELITNDLIKKFDSLIVYANSQMNIHSKRFNVRPLQFNSSFVLQRA